MISIVSVDHFLLAFDSQGLRFYGFTIASVFSGIFAGSMACIMVDLVVSWISVIDGGKTKQTPKWATNFSWFSKVRRGKKRSRRGKRRPTRMISSSILCT